MQVKFVCFNSSPILPLPTANDPNELLSLEMCYPVAVLLLFKPSLNS